MGDTALYYKHGPLFITGTVIGGGRFVEAFLPPGPSGPILRVECRSEGWPRRDILEQEPARFFHRAVLDDRGGDDLIRAVQRGPALAPLRRSHRGIETT